MALCGYRILLLANCALLAVGAGRREPVPPFFLANHGQAPSPVRFIAKAPGWTGYFSPGEALFHVAGTTLRMRFEGAAHASRPEARNRLPGVVNFLIGRKDRWLLAQPMYGGVVYRNLYPGIDMVYEGDGQNLKSEFVVAPRADPSAIHVRYLGGDKLRVGEDGSLAIPAGTEEFREEAPIVYQERDGRRVAVEGRFVLAGEAVSFTIGEYDASLPLIIDPAISYSTLLGGSGANAANALAVDSTGAAYLAGFTESTNFPTANPVQNFNAGGNDVFVAKLNSAGTGLVYCTYLGGSGDDQAYGIAVDATGAAYVTGATESHDFPVVHPLQSNLAGGRNAFVLKLSPAGNSLAYSTYLGGSSSDSGNGIAVDATGAAYVVGDTTSLNFPASGWQRANRGGQDAFAAKVSADGSRLVYSTYLGGSNNDHGAAIAVDAAGTAWLAGSTWSADFPVANAFQSTSGGGQDAFVSRLSADGDTLLFGSYLGGSGGSLGYPEAAQAIALDWQGNAYLAGVTSSTNFPLLNPLQPSLNGETDAFVTKVNTSGTLAYSSYMGGSGMDAANAIAVDSSGAAYVAGYTYSTDLPVTNAFQNSNAGDCDAFLARVSATGTLNYLTYLGGNGSDTATAVASASGNVYVAGWTLSTNFPLRNPYQSVTADNYGAFLTEVDFGSPPVNVGVTPSSGGGASQTFGFQFSDPGGITDLTIMSILFNSSPNVANGCSVVYNRAANTLSLLTDAGGPPSGSITPGSGAQQNSQCVVNGAGSSVSSAGNVLTLNLAIALQPPMAGATNTYMQSANLSAATGWGLAGSWTVPAMIVSPPNLSLLPGSSVVFQWTGIGNFSRCSLSVSGIAPGGTDIFNGVLGGGTSQLVTNLPLDNRAIYVRIGSAAGSGWLYVDYMYYAAILTPAEMISPANGSTLPGSTVTFKWSAGVGASQYWLYVSKVAPGGSDLDSINAGSQTTLTLTNLPLDGSTIYVRLSALLGGNWQHADYSFTAAGVSLAAMISPASGSTLPGSIVTFQWSAGSGVSQYWLYVSGLAPGGQDIYSATQGSTTSKTLTGLPANGSTIYIRLWSEIGSVWNFLDYSYTAAAVLAQIAPPADSASLASYLAATPFYSFDFSAFPNWDYVTPPISNELGDGVLSLAFSSTMIGFTATPDALSGGWDWDVWGWGVAPTSERADANAVLRVLDPYNPLFNPEAPWNAETNWFSVRNLTITLSRPVWTFGFEAEPDYQGSIAATFYTASSGSLTIQMNGMSYPNSRIFAATGAPITKIVIALTNFVYNPDFAIGAFRYALSSAVAPDVSQASDLSQAASPSPAAMVSPANGASLPGSTVTFHWSTGVGVSEYWLYLSKVAPGGKEIYSNSLGMNSSMAFTALPTDGSTLYVRLWSQIGAAWQYADYNYKTATIH
jgi:hypothetical protein